ncbi:MAG: TRAP transporter permease [Desulfarculaceae bacterium]|jgi:TRAP transporter 4TM/12TM fusion protein
MNPNHGMCDAMSKNQAPKKESSGKRRILTGVSSHVVLSVAAALSLFQVYFSTIGMLDNVSFRAGHLILAMIVVFGVYPARKTSPKNRVSLVDIVLSILAVVVGVYMIDQYPDMVMRQGDPTPWDIYLGIIATALVLEAARRCTGLALPLVAIGFLLYTYFGPYFPGDLAHVGFDVNRLFGQLYTTTEGIYGLPLGVMVNYVFLFILFAGFLHRSGAGDYFIRLSHAIAGRFKGGPAKTAVVASSMMATITGSSTANVVSTGAFTIPLMKRVGYRPETAGGIEVAASVGGQLTPPIMGAGAFIMAEWTGTPYIEIIAMAAIPALIYYLSVGFYVHILATKMGLKPMPSEEIPPFWPTFLEGCHLFVPLVVLMGMLIMGYTPMTSVIYAMGALVISANLRKSTRMGWRTVLEALQGGAVNAVLVTASLACAGILMCTIGLTGVGLKFSSIVLEFSGGNILLALALVAFASLFLGMELPITAAYITCAVLAVPALKSLGVPLLAAHMIVFWFSMDSTITPPVCISAYAASGISGGHPLKTGFASWKMAKALYILPVLFAYTAILTGSITEILMVAIPGCLGIFALTVAWEGFFMRSTMLFERLLMVAAMIACLYPYPAANWIGVAIFAAVTVSQKLLKREKAASVAA